MGRLLQDATTLNKEFAKTAVFSIDEKGHLEARYGDIVKAIHIIQQEMGITKTTKKEAAHTLQGSAAAVGAAWENLITGVADDNANFSKLMDNFVNSAVQASTNFIPRIEKTLVGLGKLFDGLATKVLPIITKEIPKILPGLIKSTFKLINALIKSFSKNRKALIKAGRKTVKIVWKEVTKGARTLLSKTSSWKGLGAKLADGFNKLLSKFDAEGAGGAASNVISGLMNLLLDVVDRVDWGAISVKIGEFIRGLKPLEIAGNALVFVTNLIGSISKSIMESGMDKPLETALGTLFMGIMFAPDVLKTFVQNNFSKLGNMVAKKISAKLGPVLASEKFHRLSAAGSKIGKILGGAIAVAAAAYVGAQIGDAIGTQIRKKYGSKTQRSEDTYGLMKYLFGDARATAAEWKDAFTDVFLDEDSTLYKFFNALATPFKGWKMIFDELENAFKNSTIYKALSKLGIVKTSGGSGHSFGSSGTTESKSTRASSSTKTVRPSRSTPESLSRPVSSSNKAPTKLSVNQNIKLKVGNKEFASAVENSESRLAWEMD